MTTLFLYLLLLLPTHHTAIKSTVNIAESSNRATVFITMEDSISLSSSSKRYWVFYQPILKEYDNLKDGIKEVAKITYKTELISTKKTQTITFNKLSPGTYYIGILSKPKSVEIESAAPIHLVNDSIVQIVVRKDDSYIGFLTEQLGLPFILPPKTIQKYGHQTDLRIGTDCAELAIYGRRRMGYHIPYCGPKGIVKYLTKADTLVRGTIIHFGYQVSILYEDRGEKGHLDDDDLLIHAYQDKVKIERFKDTDLRYRAFKLYTWR